MSIYQKDFIDKITDKRRKDAFSITVQRYFCDTLGNILPLINVPLKLQVSYPFYLFGKFDFDGGFKVNQFVTPPKQGTFYLYSYIKGSAFDYFQFSGHNTVAGFIPTGSLVMVFADDPININYLIYVVVTCPFQAYGSVFQNAYNDFEVTEILYQSDNTLNYNEPIQTIDITPIGVSRNEQFMPLSFKTPENFLNDFITMKLKFNPYPYHGLNSYIDVATNLLQFNFKILI